MSDETDLPDRLAQLRENMQTAVDHRVNRAVAERLADLDALIDARVALKLQQQEG